MTSVDFNSQIGGGKVYGKGDSLTKEGMTAQRYNNNYSRGSYYKPLNYSLDTKLVDRSDHSLEYLSSDFVSL